VTSRKADVVIAKTRQNKTKTVLSKSEKSKDYTIQGKSQEMKKYEVCGERGYVLDFLRLFSKLALRRLERYFAV
jgi:hypothetical protein